MTTLRIYDSRNDALAFDLRDLVDLLAPQSLEASWTAGRVRLLVSASGKFIDEFMVVDEYPTGRTQSPLEAIVANGSSMTGIAFSEAAHATHQVIWGQFVATRPTQPDTWITIRAIDGAFYELTTSDQAVVAKVRSAYKDVRVATGPVISIPIPSVPRDGGEREAHSSPQTKRKPVEITGRFGDAAVKSPLGSIE